MHAHVEALRKRVRRQYWSLFHLMHSDFKPDELARVYRSTILPVLDYCCVVYHSLLTDHQDQQVERLQKQALRIIYGPGIPYAKMRERAGVKTLRQRRIEMTDKFASKCLGGRFPEWFPLRVPGRATRTGGERYLEEFARCDRLKNTPIFYMRRRMNGKEGKKYGERNKEYRNATD